MRKILPLILFAMCSFGLMAQNPQIVMVDAVNNQLTIKNFSATSVDISSYQLCSNFQYTSISVATIESGDLDLAQDEEVTLSWASGSAMVEFASDLAIYNSSSFTDPSSMLDFVQWGEGGQARESVAVSAGIWTAGEFVDQAFPIVYTGNGNENGPEFWEADTSGDTPIVINEVDADTPSSDVMEFVELYGPSNAPLDGHVLVMYNGSNDQVYGVYDLDGYTLNGQGFFVAGNEAVPNVDLVFPSNGLQNGADGVALHMGEPTDFEGGTVTNTGLVDALVYGTGDSDATSLLDVLTPGQPQVDESSNGQSDLDANARIPDGGTPLVTTSYVQQAPTPGMPNQPACAGGEVGIVNSEETSLTLCIDETLDVIELENTGGGSDDTYVYVVTDENNIIIEVLAGASADFNGDNAGMCRIWGLSYSGTLDASTAEPGDDATMVQTDGECLELSSNFIEVNKIDCSVPVCDGGEVTSDQGNEVIVCLDETPDELNFSTTSEGVSTEYGYVVTDESNLIVEVYTAGVIDFNTFEEDVYRVWGLSYDGTLDPSTIEVGDDATMVATDGECLELSSNFVTVTTQPCDVPADCGIFFSENIEGGGLNKALEIYNPTTVPVAMADYQLVNCSNGCDTQGQFDFINDIFGVDDVIMPGDVYVIAHPDADPAILAEADITFQFLGNGDDAFGLQHIASGEVVDLIGTLDETPPAGGGWTVSGVENATQNHTIVRNFEVTQGTDDWTVGQDQWEVYEQDDLSFLGSHNGASCVASDATVVSFVTGGQTVTEDAGEVTFDVEVENPGESEITVEIVLNGGSATLGDDFTGSFPISLTFPAGSTDPITSSVTITDDMMEEGLETIELMLNGSEEGYEFGIQMHTITIEASDVPIDVYTIGEARANDEDGVPELIDTQMELRGIVHGSNLNPGGLQFSLIDETGAITVYSNEALGYTVTEGDSIHVVGTLDQFNGLAQIAATEVELISSDNELVEPDLVTDLNEVTESDLIRINCVQLVDPLEWTTGDGNGGFTVEISDGDNTYLLRIDSAVDLYNEPAPTGTFSIIGTGGQYDTSSPYDEGYQILPRYSADIFNEISASIDAPATIEIPEGGSADADFMSTGSGASYEWDFGDGNTSDEENPTHTYEYDVEEPASYTVSLTVTDAEGICSVSTSTVVNVDYVVSVGENEFQFDVYPNPFKSEFTIESNQSVEKVVIYDAVGKIVKTINQKSTGKTIVNMSDMNAGIYVIQAHSGGTVKTARLIKK
ncbi:PKD domain-containing protein [Halocola ammonii]